MGSYYAGAGPEDGILMYCDVAGSIDVFEDPACTAPAGTARCIGWDAAGSAVWRLTVHLQDAEDEGPWVIVDREFIPTRPDCRDLYRADAHHGLGRGDRAARNRRRRPGSLRPTAAAVQPSAT
jgi:hypothetical protein